MTRLGAVALVVALAAGAAAVAGWTVRSAPGPTASAPTPGASAAVRAGGPLDGATLFRTKGCASCHTGPDTTAIVAFGPDLSDAAAWAGDRRPGVSAEGYIAESVRDPGAFISPAYVSRGGPATGMPQLDVSDAEVDALVDYLLRR